MEKEQKDMRKVITTKGVTRKSQWEMMEKIQEAVLEGYVFPQEGKRHMMDTPKLFGRQMTVVMYPKDYDIPSPGANVEKVKQTSEEYLQAARDAETKAKAMQEQTPEMLEELEAISTKADLLEWAESKGFKVPEDKKVPKAIKQYLISQIK